MNGEFYFTSSQLRAARGMLNWSREDLARASGVTARTIARLEMGEVEPSISTLGKIQVALEAAGITFIPANNDGEGVRFRRS
jgi:transcriptional regulator with XRE-family HTH domain